MDNNAQASKIEIETQENYRPTIENTPIKREPFGSGPTERRSLDKTSEHMVDCFGPAKIGVTTWEHFHNVDVLGPDYHYDLGKERIIVDWDDTIKNTVDTGYKLTVRF